MIDMVWRIVSNNWYSVVINGKLHSFFSSSRGLKQGDPLSPTLFIIVAEVLSRGLNTLHEEEGFVGYGLPKWSPKISHLAYADDTILFGSVDRGSIIKMMRILKEYEDESGQRINIGKSAFYLHDNSLLCVEIRFRRLTGIRQRNFSFTYLGCPVFHGRSKICYFEDIMKNISRRILSWHNKLLSFGGKQILFIHVLQTMPTNLLFVMNPPKRVLERINQLFAKFFWSRVGRVKSKHWIAWK